MGAVGTKGKSGALSVLVVENDLLLGARIASVLSDLQFAVVGIASTANEALSLVRLSRPHLALVDVRLAGRMDAIKLARALNRVGIPTIFLGNARDAETSRRAKAAKTVAHLSAPFSPSVTYNAILSALTPVQPERDDGGGSSGSQQSSPAALVIAVRTASAIE